MNHLEKLKELAMPFYNNGDPGHDFAHILRVMNLCKKLGGRGEVDLDIVLAGALLHDVVNVPKDHPKRLEASRMAAEKGMELMQEAGYSEEQRLHTYDVILEHSFSLGKKPSSVESAVLQDADRIDALGAIGIMRTVSCGAKFKANLYDSNDPMAENRELDDKAFTLDHFYTKLFKLPDLMNTEAGKSEALKRVGYMKLFVEELKG